MLFLFFAFNANFARMPRKLKLTELNRLTAVEFHKAPKLSFVTVLDNVRSMHNVGSVFRTCDAFRCTKLFLCGITGCPPHREITKTAIGAERAVDWEYNESTVQVLQELRKQDYKIFAVEQVQDSQLLQDIIWPGGKIAFVFGNEIDGVSEEVIELCHACIEIPQAGTKHSLNISVATGIVLWEYARTRLSHLQ